MDSKKNTKEISAGKMALLAQKGMSGVRLSEKEKRYLLQHGLEELYAISQFNREPTEAISPTMVTKVMQHFFPKQQRRTLEEMLPQFVVHLSNTIADGIIPAPGWQPGSTAFALRSDTSVDRATYFKEIGKISLHLEIIKRSERFAELCVRMVDDTARERSSFLVELFKHNRIVESLHVPVSESATITRVKEGTYRLRVADTKGEISELYIRITQ